MATRTQSGSVPMPRLYFNGKHGEHGYLSHRYVHNFEDNKYPGVVFPTMEHYLHYAKAKLFGDDDLATAIMEIPTTATASIAKTAAKVKNFDQEKWDAEKEMIAGQGNLKKFTAVGAGDIRRKLLATRGQFLVYACLDKVWGIGMYADLAEYRRRHWGANVLGKVLMAVRLAIPDLPIEVLAAQYPVSAWPASKEKQSSGQNADHDGDVVPKDSVDAEKDDRGKETAVVDANAGPSNNVVDDKEPSDPDHTDEAQEHSTSQPSPELLLPPAQPDTTTGPTAPAPGDGESATYMSAVAPEPGSHEPSDHPTSDVDVCEGMLLSMGLLFLLSVAGIEAKVGGRPDNKNPPSDSAATEPGVEAPKCVALPAPIQEPNEDQVPLNDPRPGGSQLGIAPHRDPQPSEPPAQSRKRKNTGTEPPAKRVSGLVTPFRAILAEEASLIEAQDGVEHDEA